jgi:hypothetical protein
MLIQVGALVVSHRSSHYLVAVVIPGTRVYLYDERLEISR